jgi:hypothetical protein
MLQDDDNRLSRWLANRPGARYQVRKNMTEQQPEAILVAERLERFYQEAQSPLARDAAAELRRLHSVNAGLLNQNTELDKKLAELEAEGLEQARIIGMSAERELRLMAQVDELERALGIAGKALRLSIECHRCGRYIADV